MRRQRKLAALISPKPHSDRRDHSMKTTMIQGIDVIMIQLCAEPDAERIVNGAAGDKFEFRPLDGYFFSFLFPVSFRCQPQPPVQPPAADCKQSSPFIDHSAVLLEPLADSRATTATAAAARRLRPFPSSVCCRHGRRALHARAKARQGKLRRVSG